MKGQKLKDKKMCDACGGIENGPEQETLSDFRGHMICEWDIVNWVGLEIKYDRPIEFKEYIRGIH